MRAVQFDRFGGSEVLELRVKDALGRAGAMRLMAGKMFPRGTGFDFAGEVAAAGGTVTDLTPGRRVRGFLDGHLGGAPADYVAGRHGRGQRVVVVSSEAAREVLTGMTAQGVETPA